MKGFFSARRGALAGVAVVVGLAALPVSNAAASGTYVSTSSSLLGTSLPTISTTVPLAEPVSFDASSTTPLYSVNVDPHMVH